MANKRTRNHVNPLSILKDHTFEGFGNEKPIFVDVGAFRGEFMDQLSEKYTNHNYLLFEIRTPIAKKLEARFGNRKNFAIFDGDAGRNFRAIIQPCLDQGAKIEKIFVNFPDPWFKDRHKKRRFINPKFLTEIATWLPKETTFVFQTDQKFVFNETLEVLLDSPYDDIFYFEKSAYGIPTDWEQAKLHTGDEIYRMEFKQG